MGLMGTADTQMASLQSVVASDRGSTTCFCETLSESRPHLLLEVLGGVVGVGEEEDEQ